MSSGGRFLVGFAGGVVGLILVIAVLLGALADTGRLKAPSFANRLSFDEKIRLLRREHPADVEVLAVGSSTTLHGVDGDVLRRELGFEGGVVNLGVQDLRTNQIRYLAQTFLSYYEQTKQVIMVSTMLDFKNCHDADPQFFNQDHVIDYLSHDDLWREYYYQFKYLDLAGVFKRIESISKLREARDDLESVSFDQYGSLLLTVPRERINDRVWVGDPITLDPPCYDSLQALALDLRTAHLPFTYVIAPMRPGYLAGRDPDGSKLRTHLERIRRYLGDTGAVVIDAHDALHMPDDAFFDAYHLNRDKAQKLTQFIGETMTAIAGRSNGEPLAEPRTDRRHPARAEAEPNRTGG